MDKDHGYQVDGCRRKIRTEQTACGAQGARMATYQHPLTVRRTRQPASEPLSARRRMASGESRTRREHRRVVDISRNRPQLRARSQWQEHCVKPCGAVEREPRQLNPGRPRGNSRPVSHNSVFLRGDGVASAPLMRTSRSHRLHRH
jgi:hypothetical protein